jgi:hypothetical protein
MTSISKNSPPAFWRSLAGACAVSAALAPLSVLAASPVVHHHGVNVTASSIKPFDVATWNELVQRGPRPAAYVFTTTYCSTCPDAFDKLQTYVKTAGKKVELAAIIMDVSAERALPHLRHFAGANRFYVFDGFEPAIRQSVDPKWPNITPYIVLLGRNGSLQKTIGPPDAAMMKRWLE